jgi:transcriptional regulator with XRE-family HTH domain
MKAVVPCATDGNAGKAMITEADIACLVRGLRERTGLTQEKFAVRLGVTFPTINRWENGHAKPSPLALRQIENLARELGDQGQDMLGEFLGKGNAR